MRPTLRTQTPPEQESMTTRFCASHDRQETFRPLRSPYAFRSFLSTPERRSPSPRTLCWRQVIRRNSSAAPRRVSTSFLSLLSLQLENCSHSRPVVWTLFRFAGWLRHKAVLQEGPS